MTGTLRRPPNVPIAGGGLLLAVSGVAFLYAGAARLTRPSWEAYPLIAGELLIGLGILSWALAERTVRPRGGLVNPQIRQPRAFVRLASGAAIVVGEVIALFVFHIMFSAGLLVLALIWMVVWLPPSRRQLTSGGTITVNRPREEVFTYVSDLENEPRYIPELREAVRLSKGAIGIGTRFRWRTTNFEAVEEIVEYSQPDYFSTRPIGPERVSATMRLDSISGGTRITFSYVDQLSWPRAVIGCGVRIGTLRRNLSRQRLAWFQNLKQILEGNPGA